MYNHTPNGSKTLRLSGRAANEIVGLGKVLKVVPGDSIHMEVYATYYSPKTDPSFVAGNFLGLLSGLFGPGAGLGIDGSGFTQSLNQMLGSGQLLKTGDENDDTPRAYINYILFDENFILQDFDFKRVTEAGHKTGTAAAHDKLELATIVSKPGYLYIYLSNENDKIVDVYFDDLKITHHHSPIVQAADYYPFGMTFNSYQRTNSAEQRFMYNGVELNPTTQIYETLFRGYDPSLGRFMQIDPLADLIPSINPYSFAFNNPISFSDPSGLLPEWLARIAVPVKQFVYNITGRGNQHAVILITKNGKVVGSAGGKTQGRGSSSTSSEAANSDNDNQKVLLNIPNFKVPNSNISFRSEIAEYVEPIERKQPKKVISTKQERYVSGQKVSINGTFVGSEFQDRKKAVADLYLVSKSLLENQNLNVIIQIGTNLTWSTYPSEDTPVKDTKINYGQLNRARAEAVIDVLVNEYNVPRSQIKINKDPAYGEGNTKFIIQFR